MDKVIHDFVGEKTRYEHCSLDWSKMGKKIARSFGDKVKIVEITPTLENVRKYGTSDPLINGKLKLMGPASEENVGKAIQEEIDRFKH